MATTASPIALYAQSDQAKAQSVLQTLGGIPGLSVPNSALGQSIQAAASVLAQLATADPIVLLVSSASRNSALFQSIGLYTQQQLKRLIVIDLDNQAHGAVSGALGDFSDSVISVSDPELPEVIAGKDRWKLPGGGDYPERKIKRQKKC